MNASQILKFPLDEEVSGTFDILTHEDIERIRSLMTSGNNMSLGAIEKAITFYNSCVDTSTIEKQSLPSLHQLLTNLGMKLLFMLKMFWF